MQSLSKNFFKLLLAAFITVLLLRAFVVDSFIVRGNSMSPAVLKGDYVFVNKFAYRFSEPQRKDIIVVRPRAHEVKVIKRIIGLPGERVEIQEDGLRIKNSRSGVGVILSEPYLNLPRTPLVGTTVIKLDPQEYFVLGDNRNVSIDSREMGPVDKWEIRGRVFFTISLKLLRFKFF